MFCFVFHLHDIHSVHMRTGNNFGAKKGDVLRDLVSKCPVIEVLKISGTCRMSLDMRMKPFSLCAYAYAVFGVLLFASVSRLQADTR